MYKKKTSTRPIAVSDSFIYTTPSGFDWGTLGTECQSDGLVLEVQMYDSATKAAASEGGVATVVHTGEGQRIQWTVKGIDQATVDLAREAARKNGMKLGAWVSLALQRAAEIDENRSSSSAHIEDKIDTVSSRLTDEIRTLSDRCVSMSAELQNIHTALFKVVLDEKSRS